MSAAGRSTIPSFDVGLCPAEGAIDVKRVRRVVIETVEETREDRCSETRAWRWILRAAAVLGIVGFGLTVMLLGR